jgi:uncharacterized membrane protein
MVAAILALFSFFYYFICSSLLYLSLHNNAWDLGVFNQVLYNTAHFRPFTYSFRPFGNYLGDHFSPILAVLSPLTLLESSLPILVAQAGGLALSVLVLYLLSLTVLKSRWLSLAIAFSFAINPFTLNIINFDFHPDFAFPLLFFATFYFLFNRRYRISFTFLALLQLVREDAFLLVLPLALIAFNKFKAKKLAIYSFVLCLTYSVLSILVVMPLIRDGSGSPLSDHYPYLGRSPGEIGLNVARNPLIVVQKLSGLTERTTIIKFLGSTGFLTLLSPGLLFLSAPIFLAHFLSVVPMRINLEGHYPAQLLAFMYVAVVFGSEYLNVKIKDQRSELQLKVKNFIILNCRFGFCISISKFLRDLGERLSLSVVVSIYLVAVSVVSFTSFSPFPPSLSANIDRFTVTSHHWLFFQLIKLIPDGVSVSAQTNLVPDLAFRKNIYEFPDLREADYVFLDEKGSVSGNAVAWGYYQKKENLPKCGYQLIKDEDGFKIYKKDSSYNLFRVLGC